MTRLAEYQDKYIHAAFSRDELGVLEVRFHTNGGEFVWSRTAHEELSRLFHDIGRDPDNRVVVLTGTGEHFMNSADLASFGDDQAGDRWEPTWTEGSRMLFDHLAIEVPVICAVNGRFIGHSELAVLCDIIIASEDTAFQDGHLRGISAVPGDGIQLIWMALLGPNRGRHFLYMSTELDAAEALRLGVVGEVLPKSQVLPRAREIARDLAQIHHPTLKYTRTILVQELREKYLQRLGATLAYEGLAIKGYMSHMQQILAAQRE